jgi:hypothetical protein
MGRTFYPARRSWRMGQQDLSSGQSYDGEIAQCRALRPQSGKRAPLVTETCPVPSSSDSGRFSDGSADGILSLGLVFYQWIEGVNAAIAPVIVSGRSSIPDKARIRREWIKCAATVFRAPQVFVLLLFSMAAPRWPEYFPATARRPPALGSLA